MKPDFLNNSWKLLTDAEHDAVEAFWDRTHDLVPAVIRHAKNEEITRLEAAVQDLAEHLGFALVPIQTPQQAHESMIAKRLAEDGVSGQVLR